MGLTKERAASHARYLIAEAFNTAARKITDEHRDKGGWASQDDPHYPYIHLSPNQFDELIELATSIVRHEDGLKFLDVGAGVGEKVMFMQSYMDVAHGIELREEYVEESKRLFDLFGIQKKVHPIFQGDALKFKGYGRYDIIYFYRPMKDEKMQKELEDRIISQTKSGTVIVGVLSQTLKKRDEVIQLGYSDVFIRK